MEKPPIIDRLFNSLFEKHEVQVDILREDLLHPLISGNKYWKLKYYIEEARAKNLNTLISFGGAYSNHIHALAYTGEKFGFNTIGFIRGEELATKKLNPTLSDAEQFGMKLKFISRKDYKRRYDVNFLNNIENDHPDSLIIPEGGAGQTGEKGIEDMIHRVQNISQYHYIVVCAGTGTSAAGIAKAVNEYETKIIAVPALNLTDTLKEINDRLIKTKTDPLIIWQEYTFGGYGKFPDELQVFCKEFQNTYNILPDPVYTSKGLYGLIDKISQKYFKMGSRILFIHTGGLQGWRGYTKNLSD
ncbi:pyridoxal-phosphate dependent enzyme [Mangrovivirga sp. M17]|uniref:Pyridoxal-phosphate dependent enzyme n=1 Tax=Mangrovivirga halotolerans TaxID=2993936 RepID=A0ABT3RTU0_9BACT|nr:pyridoxal-phosphate dependent enzyme [Mangrovivirga halotolerans]MCX2744759.1 pyridoxal-phosphate dependent enzyme [Mangrovivirga halotolerans]